MRFERGENADLDEVVAVSLDVFREVGFRAHAEQERRRCFSGMGDARAASCREGPDEVSAGQVHGRMVAGYLRSVIGKIPNLACPFNTP